MCRTQRFIEEQEDSDKGYQDIIDVKEAEEKIKEDDKNNATEVNDPQTSANETEENDDNKPINETIHPKPVENIPKQIKVKGIRPTRGSRIKYNRINDTKYVIGAHACHR